jgi:hypothetical protein
LLTSFGTRDAHPNASGPSPEECQILPDRTLKPIEPRTGEPPPDPSEAGAGPELDGGEELLLVLRGIGSVMFLTTDRMIVARDGFERRPRTGIQSFPLETIRHLRLELGASPSGRIAIWSAAGHEVVSMFFDARSFDRANQLIEHARPLIASARRRGPGERPVRPPNGPAGPGSSRPA